MNQPLPAAVHGPLLRLQHRPEDLGGGEADRDKRLLGPGAGDEGAERLNEQNSLISRKSTGLDFLLGRRGPEPGSVSMSM